MGLTNLVINQNKDISKAMVKTFGGRNFIDIEKARTKGAKDKQKRKKRMNLNYSTTDNIKEKKEIAKNLASSKEGVTYSQLLDIAKEFNLDKKEIDKRYQLANANDLSTKEGIYFILFGEAHPNKKGYTY